MSHAMLFQCSQSSKLFHQNRKYWPPGKKLIPPVDSKKNLGNAKFLGRQQAVAAISSGEIA
jgi:hypothetical protein